MKLQPLLILSVCFSSMLIAVSRGAEPLDIGSGRQLFLDDFISERIDGLERVMHQPVKRGAVIKPDQPWETSLQTRCSPAWGEERKRFNLWLITSTNIPGFAGTSYAESKDGVHWTKPFTATGDQLRRNVDVRDGGKSQVEVLDEDRNPIRGFELSGSVPLRGRSIEQTVRWTTKANWSQLAGKNVRLRIRIRNADLYAFWTAKE
jgi:hypothetical protein